jgi:hypothetical protein
MALVQRAYSEPDIQAIILAYGSKQHRSIRGAAGAFSIPYHTLRSRLDNATSKSQAHESQQILSYAEELTLIQWISRLTRTGFPALPALVIAMTEEIHRGRFQLPRQLLS